MVICFNYKKSLKNSHLCVQERFMKEGEVKESVCEDTTELGATQTFTQQAHTVSQPSFSISPPPAASLFVRCGSQHLHVTFQPQTLPLTHTCTHTFSLLDLLMVQFPLQWDRIIIHTHTDLFLWNDLPYTHTTYKYMNANQSRITSFTHIRYILIYMYNTHCILHSS